ncbi:MAG: DUF99 family protein, partial [Candidatus Thermoplasmatota archaeon]|nr:DUF99 family protein [Candidatus Thermoplasmatota archaeon]
EALKKHFDDWEYRCELITKNKLFTVETRHQPLHVSAWGISQEDAAIIIRNNTIRGAVPECLRVAHLIARGIVEGESRGRA